MAFRAIPKSDYERLDPETQRSMVEQGLYPSADGNIAGPENPQRTVDDLIAALEETVAALKAKEDALRKDLARERLKREKLEADQRSLAEWVATLTARVDTLEGAPGIAPDVTAGIATDVIGMPAGVQGQGVYGQPVVMTIDEDGKLVPFTGDIFGVKKPAGS